MSSLPAVIFQFALSPYADWQQLAWTGALIITLAVLTLSIVARVTARRRQSKCNLMPSRDPRGRSGACERISIRNLDFYYGDDRALKSDQPAPLRAPGDGVHRPFGLRQVDAVAGIEPHVRPLSQSARRGRGDARWGKHPVARPRPQSVLRSRVGMVFQKPTPFPMTIYDNIAFGIRLYERLPKSEIDGRVEKACAARRCGTRSRTS